MTARALLASIFVLLLFAFSATAYTRLPAQDEPVATILCYHIVESPQDPRMEISRDAFRQQMRYLSLTGYNVIPLRQLYEYVSGMRRSIPKNAVVITIDDGWRSTYTEVFPEMQKRRFPFTVFIYPRIIGQTPYAMTWKQVKELSDAGVDIQSHSLSHPYLTHRRHTNFDDKAYNTWLQRELVESKKILEHQTGHEVTFLAYPYGDYDHSVVASAAHAGYLAAMTCESGPVRRGSDPLRMRRLAVEKRTDFATFRHLLGAGSMPVDPISPAPGQTFDPIDGVVTAKLPKFKSLDPQSVGITLMGLGMTPFSYDPRDGSITLVLRDAVSSLKGKYERALIWATEAKSGKRVEASLVFKLPEPPILPALAIDAAAAPKADALTTSAQQTSPTQAVAPTLASPASTPAAAPAAIAPVTTPTVPAGGSVRADGDGKPAHVTMGHATQP
jgi:peptidoglycan/xylan/chitin deacetylase (PgdA/CDA1 family)